MILRSQRKLPTRVLGFGIAAGVSAFAACGGEEPPLGYTPPECEVQVRHYRIVDLPIAKNGREANEDALKIPGDDLRSNSIGSTIAAIHQSFGSAQDTWQSERDAALRGEVAWLVRMGECQNGYREVSLHEGEDLDADERFELKAVDLEPATGMREESIVRTFEGQARAPIGTIFDIRGGHDPGWVSVLGLTASFSESESGIAGKIGFGVPTAHGLEAALPGLATFFSDRLIAETSRVAEEMDVDGNGAVSEAEVAQHSMTRALTTPDLDLLARYKGEDVYWPQRDGLADHLSYSFRFTALEVEVE